MPTEDTGVSMDFAIRLTDALLSFGLCHRKLAATSTRLHISKVNFGVCPQGRFRCSTGSGGDLFALIRDIHGTSCGKELGSTTSLMARPHTGSWAGVRSMSFNTVLTGCTGSRSIVSA